MLPGSDAGLNNRSKNRAGRCCVRRAGRRPEGPRTELVGVVFGGPGADPGVQELYERGFRDGLAAVFSALRYFAVASACAVMLSENVCPPEPSGRLTKNRYA